MEPTTITMLLLQGCEDEIWGKLGSCTCCSRSQNVLVHETSFLNHFPPVACDGYYRRPPQWSRAGRRANEGSWEQRADITDALSNQLDAKMSAS